ncbi:MAG TPA: dCMP deaminase family protein [Acidimicrobiia bacterium]
MKWDRRFLAMAKQIAGWSKDPSTQVGAVVVRPDRTIASLGYNGFPRGSDDTYKDREHKLLRTVHAELNAILSAREPLHGYTIYVTPLCPCASCAGAIVQSGISRAVFEMDDRAPVAWADSFAASQEIMRSGGVDTEKYLRR